MFTSWVVKCCCMRSRNLLFVSALILVVFLAIACRVRTGSYTADISTGMPSAGLPQMSGRLYLSDDHIRLDWGLMSDVFDLKQRKGWRIMRDANAYMELGSNDLSSFAPEMTNGSLCSHTQVPSECKLVGTEVVEGRTAKKWNVFNPNGFHVSFWTDEQLGITLRMAMSETTTYQVTNLRQDSVPASMFQLPSGYRKVERPFKP